ncbi:hypothetical protein A6B43_00240 [Vespertiliibacter pulmonis]|uniref:Uncharacterized protein n=1 Tax=Vespertiliibacter pulmonis TaxID=1443036 RepID=A0A3N4WJC1_9PAST|nr:hypothetical protein [Vespertiliibacter pulmonis]QLB20075.1 hypothetical protein A6B43_00240 [Vespertiliibacter pulmonis]RPE86040.1 hypothetical protein EDC46_0431 [Vespertiliibacter pulmonis]
MNNIQTHTHIQFSPSQSSPKPRFNLDELFPTSSNIDVRQYPKRVIVWGLVGDETVTVHIARVQSLGNPHWTLTDDCCPCPIEPSILANVQHMPYKKCKQAVVLTANEPAIHIDDAGTYYFEYHGTNSVIIDHYDDPVIPKNRYCDCGL